MNHDGVSTATMLLLAAFAVDRVASAVTFLAFRPRMSQKTEEAARAAWSQKLWYFIIAALVAIAVLAATDKVRLLEAMGIVTATGPVLDRAVDLALTFMVLVGGAERISALLQKPTPAAAPPEPLQVSGTIQLVDKQSASPSS